jgi:hypothetical protein
LQSRRQSVTDALAQLERQQARLLELFLAEKALDQQLRQLELQARWQLNITKLAAHIQDFCQHIEPTLAIWLS